MKCEEAEHLMMDYLDNSLDELRHNELEGHLENCERCLDEIKDLRKVLERMDSEKMEIPDESLKINFYHMLHNEINRTKEQDKNFQIKPQTGKVNLAIKIAAGIALFLCGSLAGLLVNGHKKADNSEIAELRSEMTNMKELVMLSMLKDESASQRLQAVSYSDDFSAPDPTVLQALAKTMNEDKNLNVRIAAAYSLSKFSGRQDVRDTLVASLYRQSEPVIQVILMNILVEMKESKAVQPIQKIISNDKTIEEVRDVARKSINVLL
jgi:hypothetical protein